jgi:hypothetical protein
MESKGVLRCSNDPHLYHCSDLKCPLHTRSSHLFKIHINVILSSVSLSTKCTLSLWSGHHNTVSIPLLLHSCHIPNPSPDMDLSWALVNIVPSTRGLLWLSKKLSDFQNVLCSIELFSIQLFIVVTARQWFGSSVKTQLFSLVVKDQTSVG